MTGLAITTHTLFVRQLDEAATANLEEKARGLHGYLQFKDGVPVLDIRRGTMSMPAAFVDDATDYYQVYDANRRTVADAVARRSRRSGCTTRLTKWLNCAPTPGHTTFRPIADGCAWYHRHRSHAWTGVPGAGRRSAHRRGRERWPDSIGCCCGGFWAAWRWRRLPAAGWPAAPWRPLSRLAFAAQAIGDHQSGCATVGARRRRRARSCGARVQPCRLPGWNQSVGEMRQFSAALAHELRTPLAILRGEAELALRSSSSDEDLRQVLMRQIDEFDRLTRLIGQILTLARAEGGEITMAERSRRSGGARRIGCRTDRAGCRRAGPYADMRGELAV